jgi:uncharacterized protein
MNRPDAISLENIQEEPVGFEFELALPAASLDREPLVELSPVRFTGEVSRIEGGFRLDGEISYRGRLECSRCLVAYPFDEEEHFSLTLYQRSPAAPGEIALGKSDLDAYFYEEPTVAVVPIVEERIQLAVPMKPLCSPECRGLCPQCGAELNSGPCGCESETTDPRWEALKVLRGSPEEDRVSLKISKKV